MVRKEKKKVFSLFAILFLVCYAGTIYGQDSLGEDSVKNSSKAIDIFKAHLSFADTMSSDLFYKTKKPIEINRIEKTIKFLERITQISSTAEYTYVGRFKIPREDYKRWKEWFCENKQYLQWDSKKEKVIVLKSSEKKK